MKDYDIDPLHALQEMAADAMEIRQKTFSVTSGDPEELDERINEFLKRPEILKIQFIETATFDYVLYETIVYTAVKKELANEKQD